MRIAGRCTAVLAAYPDMTRGKGPGAFTLLEIMIVVGMAALVMAISIPFVQRTIRRDAVYHAVHTVKDACRDARASAIFNNATAELVIRPRDKEIRVQPGTAPVRVRARSPEGFGEEGAQPTVVHGGLGRQGTGAFTGHLGEDVSVEMLDVNFIEFRDAEEARVRFYPNGTSDEFTIVMRIGASAWRKISLDLVTGLPTLEVIR
jgi:Tfp pilus assembly protein FimT